MIYTNAYVLLTLILHQSKPRLKYSEQLLDAGVDTDLGKKF